MAALDTVFSTRFQYPSSYNSNRFGKRTLYFFRNIFDFLTYQCLLSFQYLSSFRLTLVNRNVLCVVPFWFCLCLQRLNGIVVFVRKLNKRIFVFVSVCLYRSYKIFKVTQLNFLTASLYIYDLFLAPTTQLKLILEW